ncbi:hypothetical protein AC579_4995 [Lecanosticta acicola]|uniref:Uncharacterized protein n=1 Tax=Lecanosticta acicola TaxID=111012 RepID=A0AAI9E8J1_9PEZI|nr:hypothetical protein AC579_4995 [Lecanosticta acicola]
MVATRNHPSGAYETDTPPKASPTKRSTRTSVAASDSLSARTAASPTPTPTRTRASTRRGEWAHTPSNLTLIWLAVSLPLVIWDTGYVLLRPHSMPGGALHYPIWSPYELYGRIDRVYGFEAIEAKNGWTAAQGLVNAIETAAYLAYLYIVYQYGEQEPIQGRGAPGKSVMGRLRGLSESRTLTGRLAAVAVLIGFSTATVTFWKTVLYWLIEIFSGFHSIGHNDMSTIVLLWVLPNGPWLVLPLYMIYVFGAEILQGLETATGANKKSG